MKWLPFLLTLLTVCQVKKHGANETKEEPRDT